MSTTRIASLLLLSVTLCACGKELPEASAATTTQTPPPAARTDSIEATAFPSTYKRIVRDNWTLGPDGAGALKYGMTLAQAIVATKGDFITRRANLDCSYFKTSRSPIGVKVLVADRVIVRIDVDSGATATPEGIRIGSTEAEVARAYGDSVEVTPHKYTGGHVLTVYGAGKFRYVFETDGKRVTRYRAGIVPQVEWVEGCG